MSVLFSRPIPICRSSASYDIPRDMLLKATNEVKAAVVNGNFIDPDATHDTFSFISRISKQYIKRYIAEGSYYPALTLAMRKRDFAKVLNVLDTLQDYSSFLTPTIRLCHAACLHQLDKKEECLTMITKCDEDFNVPDLLDELVQTKRFYEKMAFQKLRDEVLPQIKKTKEGDSTCQQ